MRATWLLLAMPLLAACPGKLDDPCFELYCDAPTRVFQPTCEGSVCHQAGQAPAMAGDLDLQSPGVEDRIRGKPSECPGLLVFDPAAPERSTLYLKLGDDPPCQNRMPYSGIYLDEDSRLCVLDWLRWQACRNPP